MAQQPAANLVHIAQAGTDNSPRSKAQQEFNRFSKRIAKLEKEVSAFREAATGLRQRVQAEYRPLQHRHNEQRAQLAQVLDHAHATYKLSKTERAKIADLIVAGCHDLPTKGFAEVQPIIDKYAPPPPTAAELRAEDEAAAELMKQLFTLQYGIEFDPAADVSTPEKLEAYVRQALAAQQAEDEAAEQAREERRARRKKSPKQQAAEEKKQAETKGITHAVRTLYLDLVKHLHPDREPDDTEKARKTALMQRVTIAYEAGELLTLLRLQLELQRIDQSHLENLADDQLRYYNQLLREQTRELDQVLFEERQELAAFTGKAYLHTATPAALDYDFERQKQQLEAKIKQLAAEVLAFGHDPAALKAWLKDYKIPKAGPGGPGGLPRW